MLLSVTLLATMSRREVMRLHLTARSSELRPRGHVYFSKFLTISLPVTSLATPLSSFFLTLKM